MSYQFTTKRATRLIIAIVISFAMIFTGFALIPAGDTNSYAAQNDTALTVTLTGAKASLAQEYYDDEENDSVYVPSTDGTGNGTYLTVTRGSIDYIGKPLPYQTPVYDEAELWVYSPNAERWQRVASDTLYDDDAARLAWSALYSTLYPATPLPTPTTPDQENVAANALRGTVFAKPAFEFHFDSKYKGMKATVVYYNAAQTVAAYGQIPDQTIGGYFGDIGDYVDNKVVEIQTFTLGAGSKTFALKKAVFETLKVTPVSGKMTDDNSEVDRTLEQYQDTNGYASLITNDRGGTIEGLDVPNLSLSERKWDPAIQDYKYTKLFSDPATGTYIFPALPGQKLIFNAEGTYQDGSKDADGNYKPLKSYQSQWLGGYKAGYFGIVGNPKTVKKVTAGKKNATVGTIKLAKGTATIKGTVPNSDGTVYAEGVAKDQYVSESSKQETVAATFAEYAASNDGKATSKKNVTRQRVYVAATEDEYIADQNRNTVEKPSSSVSFFGGVEVSKDVYAKLPGVLKYDRTEDPFDGVLKYYSENYKEVAKAVYDALPPTLQVSGSPFKGKYYQWNYTEITQEQYNALPSALRAGSSVDPASGTTKYFKDAYTFYKPAVAAATEPEYIAYQSGAYSDIVRITPNYMITAVANQAAYDALPDVLQGPTWTNTATGATTYYQLNYTEITQAEFDALPWGEDTEGNEIKDTDSGKYYKANWVTAIDKAAYDASPNNLRGKYTMAAVPATATTAAVPASIKYLKFAYSYEKVTNPYVYWKDSPTYKIENLPSGVYAVNWGGQTKVITVKAGKTYTFNLKAEKDSVNAPYVKTNVTGTKKKGQKLTAAAYIDTPGFGAGKPTYTYYWTDGAKIVSKKAALKLTKTTAKKNLWAISVAKIGSYQYPTSDGWQAAPGNKWGAIAFDVTVTGTFKKGKKVKVNISNKQVAGVTYKYQWLRNGKAIKKATKATYKLTSKDKGKKISVKVIGTRDGFTSKTVKTKAKKCK